MQTKASIYLCMLYICVIAYDTKKTLNVAANIFRKQNTTFRVYMDYVFSLFKSEVEFHIKNLNYNTLNFFAK